MKRTICFKARKAPEYVVTGPAFVAYVWSAGRNLMRVYRSFVAYGDHTSRRPLRMAA